MNGLIGRAFHPGLPFGLGIKKLPSKKPVGEEGISKYDDSPAMLEISCRSLIHHSESKIQRSLQPSLRIYTVDENTGECLPATAKLNESKEYPSLVTVSDSGEVSHKWLNTTGCTSIVCFSDAISPQTIILFELRETANEHLYQNRPLAWAFFRPHRTSSKQNLKEIQTLKLQVFKWQKESHLVQKQAEHHIVNKTSSIPNSFIQYMIGRKKKYKSCIRIEMRFTSTVNEPPTNKPLAVPEEVPTAQAISTSIKTKEDIIALARWRHATDTCLAPDTVLKSLVSGDLGASSVNFSPCGCFLAVAILSDINKQKSARRSLLQVYCCDSTDIPLLCEQQAHNDLVRSLIWSPDGNNILTVSDDGYMKLWNTKNICDHTIRMTNEVQLVPPTHVALCAAFLPDGISTKLAQENVVAVFGTNTGAMEWWSPKNNNNMGLLGGKIRHRAAVSSIDTTASRIYSADASGIIIIWGALQTGKENTNESGTIPIRTIDTQLANITTLIYSNRSLFIMSSDADLNVFDLTTQRVVPLRYLFESNNNNQHVAQAMCLSPDSSMVAASDGSHIYTWRTHDGKLCVKHPLPVSDESGDVANVPISCLNWSSAMHMIAYCRTGSSYPVLLFGKS